MNILKVSGSPLHSLYAFEAYLSKVDVFNKFVVLLVDIYSRFYYVNIILCPEILRIMCL